MVDSATRLGDFHDTDADLFGGDGNHLIRVSSLVGALRRRKRVWLASGLAGLLAALAFFLVRGPQYSATTTVLLRRATINPQDPARAMETDVQLARSRTVAGRAVSQLQLTETARQFQAEYQATASTNDVLELTVRASTAAEAEHHANVLANAFLDFRGQSVQRETQVEIAALQQQSNTLQDQVRPLDDQINVATLEAGSTSAPSANNSLGDLLARRSQVNGQIATVEQRISDVTADSATVVQNTRVVDPALASHTSTSRAFIIDVVAGVLGGLAIGAGWVVVSEVVSNRVRRREDVTAALDAPVVVSVGSLVGTRRGRGLGLPGGRRSTTGQLLASAGAASHDVAKVARHLREVLATTQSPTPALVVVSVGSDAAAGLAAASTVQGLLGDGNDVLAIDLSATSALARRFGAVDNSVSKVEQPACDGTLWVVSRALAVDSTIDEWLQMHNLRDETEAVVVLATLDPAEGAGYLAALATTAVAVVTTGQSTSATLRATGQMLRAAGVRLDSAVLIGADPDDESFGVPAPAAVRPPAWA
ncbi:MAG: hypothetical protein QOK20_210 [Acidimicrobiaceae bacterium]|nr:hypothetical protein [Acidimicrobiaceae bacterium]